MRGIDEAVASDEPVIETEVFNDMQTAPAWRELIRRGKLRAAEKSIRRHLKESSNDPDALDDLGVVLARQRRFEDAVTAFRAVARLKPGRAGAWRNLARACADAGRHLDAEAGFLKVCELEPKSVGNRKALGEFYKKIGRHESAAKTLEQAVALDPQSANLHYELGRALAELKRFADARTAYLRAIELNPQSSDFFNHLGIACQESGQHEEAVKYLKEAIRLRPGVVGVYNNLGVALNEQRKFDEAIECYNKALEIDPDFALAWNNLGNSLRAIGKNDEAIAAMQTAIRLKPDYPEAFNNIAIACVQMGENEKALTWYDKALCFRPDYPECHMNRALQRLMIGDLANGWADYEWRWQLKSIRHREFKQPLWDGSPLGGKRILIYWEQGLGDSIQFIRYARELKNRGATVIFEGQPPLQHVLARTAGVDEFVPRGSALPAFDVHAPLLSLPGLCDTTLENIPSDVPYILPDPHFVNLWKPRMEFLKGLRIGIVWQGNPDHRGDHLRSIPLRLFETLARVEGVTLVSLQRNHGCDQLEKLDGLFEAVCFDGIDEEIDGFLRTAAIIKNLDLVISADTSVAHLAGSMGVPVWIAIALASDWRWFRNREDSPWYPTARLFRQRVAGEWNDVFARMTEALKERVATSPRRRNRVTVEDRRKARDLVRQAAKKLTEKLIGDAQSLLEQAVDVDPECGDSHHDLGVVSGRQGRVGHAIACFRRALELLPNSTSAYANLGLAFLQNGQIEEAIAHLRKAARLGGGSADVYNNLGQALTRIPNPAAAEGYFVKALHLRPDFAAAHCNLARSLLIQGKFEQGWLELEWRWKISPDSARQFKQPRWTGQPLDGQRVLLWVEKGADAGEIIQFIRYAAVIRQRGGSVVVECPPRLVRLLSSCTAIDRVVGAGSELPPFDFHAALLSMPAIVGTTLHTVPPGTSYLNSDPALTQKWAERIKKGEGLNVGIAWGTDPEFDLHDEGAIPLELFSQLSQSPGVNLLSLQRGPFHEQLVKMSGPVEAEDLGRELDNDPTSAFLDTAAAMMHLDLVVTSDNTLAHLAGAIGVPVWLVLPTNANFRWLLDRQDSPWYPTLRIFRQEKAGEWAPVFERISEAIRSKLPAPVYTQAER